MVIWWLGRLDVLLCIVSAVRHCRVHFICRVQLCIDVYQIDNSSYGTYLTVARLASGKAPA
jgi:hypothetical protein